MMLIHLDSL